MHLSDVGSLKNNVKITFSHLIRNGHLENSINNIENVNYIFLI